MVVYNARSGDGEESREQRLAELFAGHGVGARLLRFDPPTAAQDLRRLVAEDRPEAVIVAGGDGTVRSVAIALDGTDLPLGVLPSGTMNVLAQDLGVPTEPEAAVAALLTARVERIDVATVNGQPFLCSSTLAMMPHLGRLRERARGRPGRETLPLLGRLARLLRRYPRMPLTVTVDGTEHRVRTRALVVSNNPLAPTGPIHRRDRLDTGRLAVYVVRDRSGWDLLAITARVFDGSWRDDHRLLAVCGDLTQTAREPEFRAARDFLAQLPAPALVVPGNHDLPGWRVWSRFARPWRRWRQHIGTDPYGLTVCRVDGAVAVGVNTARQWSYHLDWSRGRISKQQLTGVRAVLDRADPDAGELRVVVTHHPFLLTPAGQRRGLVGRSAVALDQLRRRVDLLLGGHIHLAYSDVVDEIVVAQSGTAISNRHKGEPNSYNLIDAEGAALAVRTRQWDGTGYATVATRRYRCRPGGGWRADP